MGFLDKFNKIQMVAGGSAMDYSKLKGMLEPGEELITAMQIGDFGLGNYDMVLGLTNKRVLIADSGLVFKVAAAYPLNQVSISSMGIARRALIEVNGRKFRIGIAAQGRDFVEKFEKARANYMG